MYGPVMITADCNTTADPLIWPLEPVPLQCCSGSAATDHHSDISSHQALPEQNSLGVPNVPTPPPARNGEPPSPSPPTLSSLIKLGRGVSPRQVDHFLAALLRRRKHRLLTSIASQALGNSLVPTPRTHLLASYALLDSKYPREAAKRLALAPCSASRRLWDALLRRACAGRGDPRLALELLSSAVDEHGASPSESTYHVIVLGLCARGEVDGALRVLDIMTQRGCQVDDRVCSSIVAGFSRSGMARVGLEFYERVRILGDACLLMVFHV